MTLHISGLTSVLLTLLSKERHNHLKLSVKRSIIPTENEKVDTYGNSARSSIMYMSTNTSSIFEANNITSMDSFMIYCKLGSGHTSRVYKVQKIDGRDKGCFYALKVIPAHKTGLGILAKEYEILEKFQHPFILNMTYIFKDSKYAYAVSKILVPFVNTQECFEP